MAVHHSTAGLHKRLNTSPLTLATWKKLCLNLSKIIGQSPFLIHGGTMASLVGIHPVFPRGSFLQNAWQSCRGAHVSSQYRTSLGECSWVRGIHPWQPMWGGLKMKFVSCLLIWGIFCGCLWRQNDSRKSGYPGQQSCCHRCQNS